MNKKILLLTTATLIFAFFVNGCATLFGPKSHSLPVSSEPHGAEIYVNGFKMGTTPMELNLTADKTYNIEFRKEGFESVTRVVNTKIGAGWVVLDVIGGLLPVVVDAATGAWYKLDQESVNAVLVEQNK